MKLSLRSRGHRLLPQGQVRPAAAPSFAGVWDLCGGLGLGPEVSRRARSQKETSTLSCFSKHIHMLILNWILNVPAVSAFGPSLLQTPVSTVAGSPCIWGNLTVIGTVPGGLSARGEGVFTSVGCWGTANPVWPLENDCWGSYLGATQESHAPNPGLWLSGLGESAVPVHSDVRFTPGLGALCPPSPPL